MNRNLPLLCCLLLISPCLAGEDRKITLEPTFEEGFGVLLRREVTLIRVDPDPGCKLQEVGYFIASADGKALNLQVTGYTAEVQETLVKLLEKQDRAKVKVVGYESIDVHGSPGLGRTATVEDGQYIIAGPGWGVGNEFVLMAIE